MPNAIRYTTGSETLALKKGNFYIGVGDVGKGPTSTTGYYNGISPPSGGYTIYLNKESNGPSIYTCSNDSQLISLTNAIAGTSYTTASECFVYFRGQTDKLLVNRDLEAVPTSGLTYVLDPGFLGSYPQSGSTIYNLTSISQIGGIFNPSLNNGVGWSSTAGGILTFDSTDDRLTMNHTGSGRLGFTDSITVSIWFYWPTNNDGLATDNMLWGFDSIKGSQLNFYRNNAFCCGPVWAVLAYYTRTNDSGGNIFAWIPYTVAAWTCIQISLSANGDWRVMVNNAVNNSGTISDFSRWNVNFNELSMNGRSFGTYFNFNMGPMLVYNRGLSSTELSTIYNAQKSRFGL